MGERDRVQDYRERERGTVDTDPMILPGGLFMGLRKSDREEVRH